MTSHSDGLDYPLFFCPLELWPGVDRDVDLCFGENEIPEGAWTFVVRHALGDALVVTGVSGTAGDDEPVPGPKITFTVPGDRVADIMRQEYVVYLDGAPEGGGPIRPADFQSALGSQVAQVTLGRPSVASVTIVVAGSSTQVGLVHDDVFPAYGTKPYQYEPISSVNPDSGINLSGFVYPGNGLATFFPGYGSLAPPTLFSNHIDQTFLGGQMMGGPYDYDGEVLIQLPEWAWPTSEVTLEYCSGMRADFVKFDDHGFHTIATVDITGIINTDGEVRLADGGIDIPDWGDGPTPDAVILNLRFLEWTSVGALPASGVGDTAGVLPWTPDLRDTATGELVDFGEARPPYGYYNITNGWVMGTAWFYFGPGTSNVPGYMVKLPADVLTEADSFKIITCGQVAVLKGNSINATQTVNGLLSGGDYNSWFGITQWPKNYAVLENSDGTPGQFSNSFPIDLGTEVGGYMRVDYSYPLDVPS